jgi:hypothetical protein
MPQELEFFQDNLKPDLGINLETPIIYLILHTPFATMIDHSSLDVAGGFSIALDFGVISVSLAKSFNVHSVSRAIMQVILLSQ